MIRHITFWAVILAVTSAGEAANDTHPDASGATKVIAARGAIQDPGKADRLVVYTASWCGPCRRLKPILNSLTEEGYRVEHLDVDKEVDELEYRYSKVPTIFFVADDVVIRQETGYREKEMIQSSLRRPAPQRR